MLSTYQKFIGEGNQPYEAKREAAIKAKATSTENVSAIPTKRHVNVSIRKQLELQHPNAAVSTAAAASCTPTSPLCSTVGQE